MIFRKINSVILILLSFFLIVCNRQNKNSNEDLEFNGKVPCYIICIYATKNKIDANNEALKLRKENYKSGYLWIPNYKSLSGLEYYQVFIGPFNSKSKCQIEEKKLKKIFPRCYGIHVSQNDRKELIKEIVGSDKSSDNSNVKTNATIHKQSPGSPTPPKPSKPEVPILTSSAVRDLGQQLSAKWNQIQEELDHRPSNLKRDPYETSEQYALRNQQYQDGLLIQKDSVEAAYYAGFPYGPFEMRVVTTTNNYDPDAEMLTLRGPSDAFLSFTCQHQFREHGFTISHPDYRFPGSGGFRLSFHLSRDKAKSLNILSTKSLLFVWFKVLPRINFPPDPIPGPNEIVIKNPPWATIMSIDSIAWVVNGKILWSLVAGDDQYDYPQH